MSALAGSMRSQWQSFLDIFEPLRPELYKYCGYVTRSPWDAEDLVQDTLARAFATLGCLFQPPPNPRAWMFRVASNLWIDRQRRQRERPSAARDPDPTSDPRTEAEPRAERDAASTLISQLSPQERAAVVLKDVFELSLDEVADALTTSVGTVKSALHRGRAKLTAVEAPLDALAAPQTPEPQAPSARVLDAFCDAFNARDLPRLTALLLDTSMVELVGVVTEYGPEASGDPRTGSLPGFLAPITPNPDGPGIDPRHLEGYRPEPPRVEVREHRGELILLYWYRHDDGEAVRSVARASSDGDRLATLRHYFFAPDALGEVCRELGVPFRTNGYRYW
ncbi:MAG TPA: RNA polymerase sigma factor [Polyangiaceae bacterium]|nr:RNA polymerase sigma factor [Polyangiaceae bacterium]